MGSSKKDSNIFESFAKSLEEDLSVAIENSMHFIVKKMTRFISKKRNQNDSTKITVDIFKNKENWYAKDAFGYSLARKKEVFLDSFSLEKNTFICATTGAGKNSVLDAVIEDRIKKGHSVIYLSPKGDIKDIESFQVISKKYGRKPRVLSDFYYDSCTYNPLAEGDITTITERIFNSFTWSNQYYADCNYRALMGAVKNILNDKSRGIVSIKEVLKEIMENFNNDDTTDIINKLSKINNSSYGRKLSKDNELSSVSISSLKQRKESMIVSLSTLSAPDISSQIGKMIVYDLMYHASTIYASGATKSGVPTAQISLVIDELGSIATIDIINLLNKGRGAGISICAATQTLEDLRHISDSFESIYLGNCQNFFVGKCLVPNEVDFWAKFFGTNKISKLTIQMEDGQEGDRGSLRDANEYKIDPNVIRNLGVGQFVLCSYLPKFSLDVVKLHFKSSEKRVESKKINYLDTPVIKKQNDLKEKNLPKGRML